MVRFTSQHKHKHSHKHKKHKRQDSPEPKTKPQTSKTMDQLRAERMKREMLEKKKKEALMAKMRGEKLPEDTADEVEVTDRNRRYNSQYNPEFVRKHKHHQKPY